MAYSSPTPLKCEPDLRLLTLTLRIPACRRSGSSLPQPTTDAGKTNMVADNLARLGLKIN
ncbi:hypothetical protein DPMN_138116 [Dreissena polymorpha]|uniref:Uncharacterized protein n=1 Tax=Dreissena polymorpha TaxID=45954 RepID=A0A9D4G367_DREPO|nr:hypothetical protein DPMN_138116 [Dreissena polymorpha]